MDDSRVLTWTYFFNDFQAVDAGIFSLKRLWKDFHITHSILNGGTSPRGNQLLLPLFSLVHELFMWKSYQEYVTWN